MIVTTIKTEIITAGSISLLSLLDNTLKTFEEGSILAITSKIVSLCEGNVIPFNEINKEELVVRESDLYLPVSLSKYGHHFTITNNTLIPMAGVDESNGGNNYVLWPKDAQKTANQVRSYLKQRFRLNKVGVIITDSTSHPLRRGANGIMLAHSGFAALNDYVGKPDLFGKPFRVSQADVAGGLAAAAVLQMGEGSEQTPLAIISDIPFVTFQDRDPSPEELADINISLEDDLFAPFLTSVQWTQGKRKQK
ncbi:MAG TPA: coenzyme F420-0:L-glutamate ligase [Patescibacteria group bacterium]|jgi:putative folate metabolism gamma-glutamate ligase|nr:coenzyme F420-0:L-glutamate ligase [Patescibacteria group bacterium]